MEPLQILAQKLRILSVQFDQLEDGWRIMPRKAPEQVIEHRISFSNFERTQIIKQIEKNRENNLFSAGINQVGAIAGSGVLLWAAAAYFGFNLVSEVKDKVDGFINRSSSGLADTWMMAFGGLTSKEARFISKNNELLNQRVLELNAREQAKEEQIRTVNMSVINGHMTFQEAKTILDEIGEVPSQETIEERQSIVDARARLAQMKEEFGEGAFNDIIDGWPSFSTKGLANLINSY